MDISELFLHPSQLRYKQNIQVFQIHTFIEDVPLAEKEALTPDQCITRFCKQLRSVDGVQGFYKSPDEEKIVVDVDKGTLSEVREKIQLQFPAEWNKDMIEIVEQNYPIEYIISCGNEIHSHNSFGTVTCLAESTRNELYLLTVKHIFDKEIRPRRQTGSFISSINNRLQPIAGEYSGVQGAILVDGKERGVDIAALRLLPKVRQSLALSDIHTFNSLYSDTDEQLLNKAVCKCGAASGFTTGEIVHTDYFLREGKLITGGHLLVFPDINTTDFAIEGDSGSLLWSRQGSVVGIVSHRRKDYNYRGRIRNAILCVRMDTCLSALNQHWSIKLERCKAYRPNEHLKHITTPHWHLKDLVSKSFKLSKPVDLQHIQGATTIALIAGEIWLCAAQGIYVFSLNLEYRRCIPIHHSRAGQIRNVAELPSGDVIMSTTSGLYQLSKPEMQLKLIQGGNIICVLYRNHQVYTTELKTGKGSNPLFVVSYSFDEGTNNWKENSSYSLPINSVQIDSAASDYSVALEVTLDLITVIFATDLGANLIKISASSSGSSFRVCKVPKVSDFSRRNENIDFKGSILLCDTAKNEIAVVTANNTWLPVVMPPIHQPVCSLFAQGQLFVLSAYGKTLTRFDPLEPLPSTRLLINNIIALC